MQPGNVQLEGKNDFVEGDQKIVPEQFDNVQYEHVTDVQQVQKDESLDMVTVSAGVEDKRIADLSEYEKITELPEDVTANTANSEVVTNDSVPISNNKETVLLEPTNMTVTKVESELTKVESVVLESPAIEEAAA